MNAVTAQVFADARAKAAATTATKTDAVITRALDYEALARFYDAEMRQAAAPAKVADILYNVAPSLLSAGQRWERLPEATRQILRNAQLFGVGHFVPGDESSTTKDIAK